MAANRFARLNSRFVNDSCANATLALAVRRFCNCSLKGAISLSDRTGTESSSSLSSSSSSSSSSSLSSSLSLSYEARRLFPVVFFPSFFPFWLLLLGLCLLVLFLSKLNTDDVFFTADPPPSTMLSNMTIASSIRPSCANALACRSRNLSNSPTFFSSFNPSAQSSAAFLNSFSMTHAAARLP